MQRKTLIYSLRIFTGLAFLLSVLLILAVVISDEGDIIDRNAGWILLVFVISLGTLSYSLFISDGSPEPRKKTTNELLNEIKKSNLDRFKGGKKQSI